MRGLSAVEIVVLFIVLVSLFDDPKLFALFLVLFGVINNLWGVVLVAIDDKYDSFDDSWGFLLSKYLLPAF